ncbi:MAG: hypothetical protein A2589_02110 [Candidatus Vogelbacteria bacterium RIFOXYD1_FULL_46_19]|uniref:Uncharacterized protein n=1 Tax=Candidatus Vogelbacteria bacterium RIFOXYD1_FULL_46_19 TaxID=1802439 RepID=A0A1G2QHX8_9BACT|nr:MAG: hypothetical protein A2589_02110 [Candidatus Vogelbacteria bacterium RIFOXYD1_FULL_46_19]
MVVSSVWPHRLVVAAASLEVFLKKQTRKIKGVSRPPAPFNQHFRAGGRRDPTARLVGPCGRSGRVVARLGAVGERRRRGTRAIFQNKRIGIGPTPDMFHHTFLLALLGAVFYCDQLEPVVMRIS